MSPQETSPATVLKPSVTEFFDEQTNTFSYVVIDPHSLQCAVIDPVLNFDYAAGSATFSGADKIIAFVKQHGLTLEWIIETHVHADHLSSAPYIQDQLGGKLAVGEKISIVQDTFAEIFNEGADFLRDGSQFDHLFRVNERYSLGGITCTANDTPGHTPACMTHVIGDAIFVGDTLFMPDAGTARADFPGGSAEALFDSARRILQYPDYYRIFICHDYRPNGRELQFMTTVGEQRLHNIHVKEGISQSDFVAMRKRRDKTLDMPRLILPSLQVNMRAGRFPAPEDNDVVYLKVPINSFQ